MSEATQEGEDLGQAKSDRRPEAPQIHPEGTPRILEELSKLGSRDVKEVAEGVKALADLQEQIAVLRGGAWTQEDRLDYAKRIVDLVANTKQQSTTSRVWEQRSVSVWTPDQMTQFANRLQEVGVIPPASSASIPSVGK